MMNDEPEVVQPVVEDPSKPVDPLVVPVEDEALPETV